MRVLKPSIRLGVWPWRTDAVGHDDCKNGLDPDSEEDEDTNGIAGKSLRPSENARSSPQRSKVAGIKELPALARRSLQLRRWKRRQLPGQLCGVIRHAERADGIYAFINGQRWTQTEDFRQYPMDPPLSDAGIEGAKEVGQQVADFADSEGVPVHTVISSPYFRCVQTAVEVCIKLGPHIRMIIDWSLGEVYGPSVMGAFEPLHAIRPMDATLRYIAYKGVTCVQKAVGKWPTWPEDLKCARKRYANGYLSYLHRSALAKRNFVVVTHADCVGAALSMMPSQAGFAVESVEYGGMLLATRGLEDAKASSPPLRGGLSDTEEPQFRDIMPSQPSQAGRRISDGVGARSDNNFWFHGLKARRRQSEAGTGKKRMSAWDEVSEDGTNGSDRDASPERLSSPCASPSIAPPKAADGWKVRVHNVNTRCMPKEKARTSTKAMKSIKSLVRNTAYTQEQIETLLGMMSDKPLEGGEELQTKERCVKAPDSRILSRTDCSLATYIFGMSECGSNMDDCRSQCSESEFMYMAMHQVPSSREGTLDQIDESQIEPGSPLPERYQPFQGHDLGMRRFLESNSRRSGAGKEPWRQLTSTRWSENEIDDVSPQGVSAPRSATFEEMRNLNELQKRELIYANPSERREKLAKGHGRMLAIADARKMNWSRAPHSHACSANQSPVGSTELASWGSMKENPETAFRAHWRNVQRRALSAIPSGDEMAPGSESPWGSDNEDSFSSAPMSNGSGSGLQQPFPEKPHSEKRLSRFGVQGQPAESGYLRPASLEDPQLFKKLDDARVTQGTTVAPSDNGSAGSAGSIETLSQSEEGASAWGSELPPAASKRSSSEPRSRMDAGRPAAIQIAKSEAPNLTLTAASSSEPRASRQTDPGSIAQAWGSEVQARPATPMVIDTNSKGGTFSTARQKRELPRPSPITVPTTAGNAALQLTSITKTEDENEQAKASPEPVVDSFDAARQKREMPKPLRIEIAPDPEKPVLQLMISPKSEDKSDKVEDKSDKVVTVSPKADASETPAGQGSPPAFASSFAGSSLMRRRAQKAATASGIAQTGPPAGTDI